MFKSFTKYIYQTRTYLTYQIQDPYVRIAYNKSSTQTTQTAINQLNPSSNVNQQDNLISYNNVGNAG